MGLYVRANELVEAIMHKRTLSEENKFESTATYPNRLRDKPDLEKYRGFAEDGSKIMDVYTPPDNVQWAMRICRGYRRVVYGDHGPYLELDIDDIDWGLFK